MHHSNSKVKQETLIKVYLEILVLFFLLGFSISKIQQSAHPSDNKLAIEQQDEKFKSQFSSSLLTSKS